MTLGSKHWWRCVAFVLLVVSPELVVLANPSSKPYIPFRTDPFDQPDVKSRVEKVPETRGRSRVRRYRVGEERDGVCPLDFALGLSRRAHSTRNQNNMAIVDPPVVYPVHPSYGAGRQVIHTTQYELLDMLSPSQILEPNTVIKEGLDQQRDYPLLFESSSFLAGPLVHDFNADGIMDALLVDYDGGLYFVGLQVGKEDHRRYYHRAQIPRLQFRREWMEARLNLTSSEEEDSVQVDTDDAARYRRSSNDPYHSYFEYGNDGSNQVGVLRGVTADVLGQDTHDVASLEKRRNQRVKHHKREQPTTTTTEESADNGEDLQHRRLQQVEEQVPQTVNQQTHPQQILQQQEPEQKVQQQNQGIPQQQQQQQLQQAAEVQDVKPKTTEGTAGASGEGEKQDPNVPDQNRPNGDAQGNVEGQQQMPQDSREKPEVRVMHDMGDADYGRRQSTDDDDDDADDAVPDENPEGPNDDDYHAVMSGEDSGDGRGWGDDDAEGNFDGRWDDDVVHGHEEENEDGETDDEEPDYPYYDDYYDRRYGHDDYYDEKHYIRLPPHVLCPPVLAELKKAYSNNEKDREEMVFLAVSYYFDEDEFDGLFSYKRFESEDAGDETEVARGMHVANALVVYVVDSTSMRFGREEHLDLSSDPTAPVNATLVAELPLLEGDAKLGAFALSSPTVADIDGDGEEDVLIGTSMGIVYCLHARHLYKREGWPIQVKSAVESRILLEDVVGNTNLEIFINDVAGNLYSFDHVGQLLWQRDLMATLAPNTQLVGSSPMTLGDINGDGIMDLVIVIKCLSSLGAGEWRTIVVAVSAVTGDDLPNFPIEFASPLLVDDGSADEKLHQKLPQPLLVDLHADQSHWTSYLYRNGTTWNYEKKPAPSTPPHGGSAMGLHVVQPVGTNLYIMEGGSGCTQVVVIGEEVKAMVQADDVHGTNNLDLVVSTAAGNIVTLESPSVPYHPLNVWNTGEVRSRRNNHAQGFTASQGIFVRNVSRRYRDIFGVFVPITFEIFDNRPQIQSEPDKRVYKVEVRDGTSAQRTILRRSYTEPGVYTERVYINYGPGYYALSVVLTTTHGLIYEDVFHLGYNVHYLDGISLMVWLPVVLAAIPIILCSKKKAHWNDEELDDQLRGQRHGILGM